MSAVGAPVLASSDQLALVRGLVEGAGLPVEGLDGAWRTWVLAESGDAVGCVALERYASGGAAVFLLRSLVVRTDLRGSGRGTALVTAALDAADADADAWAEVALLTETAPDYFHRFGFVPVSRAELPAPLRESAELSGACADTARAFLRGPGSR